jgi:WD40 repeat protein
MEPTLRCLHNDYACSFVTASGSGIKVWDERTGVLQHTYKNLVTPGAEITAMCLDDSKKKIVLGDSNGVVTIIKYLGGTFMKRSTGGGNREITSLSFVEGGTKQIISTSWDGFIRLYDETVDEGIPVGNASV